MNGKKGARTSASPARKNSTESIEDYVKTIYNHTEWQDTPITTSILASKLGFAPSSVTEMVKKLASMDLVTHVPYGAVTLTAEGEKLALQMVRRHRLLETFLVQTFDYSWEDVHEEAEILEHAVSDRLLNAIAEKLGNPISDPHGDPIPSADGQVAKPAAQNLTQSASGSVQVVTRIRDDNSELLSYLAAEGLNINSLIKVHERKPFGGSLTIEILNTPNESSGKTLDLGDEASSAIWVSAAS